MPADRPVWAIRLGDIEEWGDGELTRTMAECRAVLSARFSSPLDMERAVLVMAAVSNEKNARTRATARQDGRSDA